MKGYTDRFCPRHGWLSVTTNVVKCPVKWCDYRPLVHIVWGSQ